MNERTESSRMRQSRTCQHRWLLETPNGPAVEGRCRDCGKQRSFPTIAEEIRFSPFGTGNKNGTEAARTEIGTDAA